MGSIFACFVSFEAISQTIGMQNLHVEGQRSLKVFWGKFFGRIRALKSSLKMNQTHSLFFEAADQAKAAAQATDRGATAALKALTTFTTLSMSHKDVNWGKDTLCQTWHPNVDTPQPYSSLFHSSRRHLYSAGPKHSLAGGQPCPHQELFVSNYIKFPMPGKTSCCRASSGWTVASLFVFLPQVQR